MKFSLKWIAVGIFVLALLIGGLSQTSAAYPDKAIRIICPYATGSGSDILIRYYARKLEPLVGQPVLVENRPGANGAVGTLATINARPDGYTLLIISTSTIAANPLTSKEIKYDGMEDLMPIAPLFNIGSVIAVNPKSDIYTIKDLTRHLKDRGNRANFSVTTTTAIGVSALYFEQEGIKGVVRVNYKSNPDAVADLAGGNLDFGVIDVTLGVARARSNQIRLVAATTAKRTPSAPELPTLVESGLDIVFESNWAAFFPKGTPPDIQKKMGEWFNEIGKLRDTSEFIGPNGAQVLQGDAATLSGLLKSDLEMWNKVSKLVDLTQQ